MVEDPETTFQRRNDSIQTLKQRTDEFNQARDTLANNDKYMKKLKSTTDVLNVFLNNLKVLLQLSNETSNYITHYQDLKSKINEYQSEMNYLQSN